MHRVMTLILALCVLAIQNGLTARILGIFAHPTRSNSQFVHAIMSTLAAAGHNVTVYSAFKPSPNSGFHHVHVLTEYHKSGASLDQINYKNFVETFSKPGFACKMLRKISHAKCDSFFKHPAVKDLLNSDKSFDLVITGGTFGEQSLLVFGHKFKASTIALLPMGTLSVHDYMAGNAVSLASTPEYFDFPFTDKMSLLERIHNSLSGTANLLMNHWYDLPGQDDILQRLASSLSPPPPPVDQMVRDIALTFVNVHPSLSYPKPYPPNIVLVGGIHIDSNSSPLPQDIQELMDSSDEGVIFCSLGSIVPIDSMPHHLVQAFVDAFRKLPQRVIWKISGKRLEKLPENVVVSSWLPQQRILEHPNLKLFFTHGGLGSQLEVFRAGVPVVGLPFTTDQPYNIKLYESLGIGVGLTLDTLSEETISTALETVLNNNSYAENARRVARLYADRPMEPKELVIYWTEYVLKHGGAHLRPQAAMMTWYQRGLLDIAAVLLLATTVILAITVWMLKYVYKWIMCSVNQWGIKYKVI